ncbi:MAG: sugar ABC transporter ATP-binding protein [Spirochaetes bacterium]|nr:MAG: sugar ABC transporter ATP-binding protein [Spirochaetota bacterium]RKX89033.1 MAG: sugar ABC transporter ATP-binding protein [Spirochaetota bacterium]
MEEELIVVENIEKSFPGVRALSDVSISLKKAEIRCLAGENGSGKSTLIKVISGIYKPEKGLITIEGEQYKSLHPIEAIRHGVQVIYQDLSLFPNLTVAENLALNSYLGNNKKLLKWKDVKKIASSALSKINVEIDLNGIVGSLTVADKQLVAISRALLNNAKIVIMDEPTTALTQKEVDSLFKIILNLKEMGISTLFVSHKLREVIEISEEITILRNGRKVAEGSIDQFDEPKIVYHMTGREVGTERYKYVPRGDKLPVLTVQHYSSDTHFEDVNFDIHSGEIIGITGLLGSGRTELALSLFGIHQHDSGKVLVEGKEVSTNTINDAVNSGIAYVPEDRLSEGLFLQQSIARNTYVSILDRLQNKLGFVDFPKADITVETWIDNLSIATPSKENPVSSLSGGNQQRVVLARWLATDAKILILNGPTVGVDIGSKEDIHNKLRELARSGLAILIISDDIPEIVQNCNRIFVMHKGQIVERLEGSRTHENEIVAILKKLK